MPTAPTTSPADRTRVCLGLVAGPHGLKGEVRVLSYTARPEDIAAYGPLDDGSGGRAFALEVRGRGKGTVIARIRGIEDRAAAAALKGTKLYIDRGALEAPASDEFYYADLVGLEARLGSGDRLGRVTSVHNFGAGDLLEVEPGGDAASLLVPFTKEAVPVVDTKDGFVVLVPPDEGVGGATAEAAP